MNVLTHVIWGFAYMIKDLEMEKKMLLISQGDPI